MGEKQVQYTPKVPVAGFRVVIVQIGGRLGRKPVYSVPGLSCVGLGLTFLDSGFRRKDVKGEGNIPQCRRVAQGYKERPRCSVAAGYAAPVHPFCSV